MRITTAAREATRRRILEFARERFAAQGFDAVTTRDIAGAAAIATGTLFNDFATKEAIAAALVAEALAEAHTAFDARVRRGDSLEEELFGFVAAELRALRPHRNYPAPVLETALGPLATRRGNIGEAMRREHLGNFLFTPRGELGLIDLARGLGRCYLRGRPSAALEIRARMGTALVLHRLRARVDVGAIWDQERAAARRRSL